MKIGFDTIGNATVICYDHRPILATDPWIQGDAYFGSWCLSHEIPAEQRQAVLDAQFIFFSHGHPDHLNHHCLPLFKSKTILLADHVGGRISKELSEQGYRVQILPDRKWTRLSENIRVLAIADFLQDSVILIEINGRLVVNLNDTAHHGWKRTVKRIITEYQRSYLLSLTGFGDVDMIHFFDESGNFIEPAAARRDPIGPSIASACEFFGTPFFIPFSAFHRYQRTDTDWANQYTAEVEDHAKGFHSKNATLLPAFLSVDCADDSYREINPATTPVKLFSPEEFGDNWTDLLERDDVKECQNYFRKVETLRNTLDWICLKVGGKEYRIEMSGNKFCNRSVTFEVPRGSLMTAVKYRIFDDLLIGNFMKTTLHGSWPADKLYPDFNPPLAKFGDNGNAFTQKEVETYLATYRARSFDERLFEWETKARNWIEEHAGRKSPLFVGARALYRAFRSVTN